MAVEKAKYAYRIINSIDFSDVTQIVLAQFPKLKYLVHLLSVVDRSFEAVLILNADVETSNSQTSGW